MNSADDSDQRYSEAEPTSTPAWMLHFGVPLGTHPEHPVYFVGEGRLFLRKIDDVHNNYQLWGGARVHL